MPLLFLIFFNATQTLDYYRNKAFCKYRGPLRKFRLYAIQFSLTSKFFLTKNRFPSMKGVIFGCFHVPRDWLDFSRHLWRKRTVVSTWCNFFFEKFSFGPMVYPLLFKNFEAQRKRFANNEDRVFRFFGIMRLFSEIIVFFDVSRCNVFWEKFHLVKKCPLYFQKTLQKMVSRTWSFFFSTVTFADEKIFEKNYVPKKFVLMSLFG